MTLTIELAVLASAWVSAGPSSLASGTDSTSSEPTPPTDESGGRAQRARRHHESDDAHKLNGQSVRTETTGGRYRLARRDASVPPAKLVALRYGAGCQAAETSDMLANRHSRRACLAALILLGIGTSVGITLGSGRLNFDATANAPSGTRAGEPLFPAAAPMAPGDHRAKPVTLRNEGAEPADLFLHTTAGEGMGGEADLCQALELEIRDGKTGVTLRTAPVTAERPIRIERLPPRDKAEYQARIRFLPRSERPADSPPDNAFQGATCPVDFAWSFTPRP